jgi:alpha/beta superfamily hydrolase
MFLRGNHETGGDFKQGRIIEDVVDLEVVTNYLKSKFGYKIDMLIGHSRGSVVAFHWICRSEDGRQISAMVNVSGRYRMDVSRYCALIDLTCKVLYLY